MSHIDVELEPGHLAVAQPVGAKISGRVIVLGWSVRETTGAASAQLLCLNGADATGLETWAYNLNASGSARDWVGPRGISFDNGYFPVVTGAVAGAVLVALHHGAER